MVPKIVLPHGGFKKLIVYRKSEVAYQGTVTFCRRFLPTHGDRTVDQMTQAARSCKQNIAEGSSASGASKETELKLTNVARATLDELIEDYLDYLKKNGFEIWPEDSEKKRYARTFAKERNDWSDWQDIFEKRPADTLANLMLVLCNQTSYMLGRMIERQEKDFICFRNASYAILHNGKGESRSLSVPVRAFSRRDRPLPRVSGRLATLVRWLKRGDYGGKRAHIEKV